MSETVENQIELIEVEGLSQSQIVRRRFFRHRGAMVSMVVLGIILVVAYTSVGFGDWHGWWKYKASDTGKVIDGGAVSLEHPFGQDEAGSDMFAQVMVGIQTSLEVIFMVGLIATILGILMGSLSGYFRGKVDWAVIRLIDLFLTMPVIVLGAVLGFLSGGNNAALLGGFLGAVLWTQMARLVRAEFLTLREREFVDAARVAGASNVRIIFKHILPNAIGVVIVNATLLMSSAILLETALSFLGVGLTPPAISLGNLISNYQQSFSTRPWLFWFPGLFIVTLALCINFIGDGLRDAFDPRQKRIPSERKMARARRIARHTPTASPDENPAAQE